MSNIVPISDIQQMAEVAATSKMFGFKNPQEAMAIMLLCQAENLHPAVAMRDYHVIQGRPALKADAMLARFQQAGGSVNWKVYTDQEVTGVFSHPAGGSLEVTWTISQAKSIGIANKDNWRNYPRAMLRARVLSEGIRSVYPGCVVGVYTPEEVQDFNPSPSSEPSKPPKVVDMGTAERVDVQPVIVEEPDGAFPLYVPGNDKPYNRLHIEEEWIAAYSGLVARIASSGKLSEAEKMGKYLALQEANKDVVEAFSSLYRVKLKAEIVKAGGSTSPKPPPSPSSMDSLPSDPEFSDISEK
jgi:hypothetical protein